MEENQTLVLDEQSSETANLAYSEGAPSLVEQEGPDAAHPQTSTEPLEVSPHSHAGSLRASTSTADDPASLSADVIENLRKKSRQSLFFFAKGILGYTRLNPRIHKPLCTLLENKANRRLRITLPRGWYKTTLCSISYPIWLVINDPEERILLVQNTHTNAIGKLSSIDFHFKQNKLFRALFPELLPTKETTWTSERMCVPRKGAFSESTFEAAGTRTKVVSRHYTKIIEDDTVAPDLDEMGAENLAPTKEDIEQAIGWHRLAMPLLTQIDKDQIIIVGTRWFEKDLLSWNAENEPSYKGYTRACREDDYGQSSETGKPTFPEQFNETVLSELEAGMGPYMYSCLYLNKPIRSENMLFRMDWFQYYDTLPHPQNLVYYTTVDPGGDPETTKGEPDWNVVITCAKSLLTGDVYCVEYSRGKWDPGTLLDELFRHFDIYKPVKCGIEAVQYQKSLLYFVNERMKKIGKWTLIEGITHGKRSKSARIMGLQPAIKAGTLKFKTHHRELISEALSFPYGKNDDIMDALSMQHGMWALTRSASQPSTPEELEGQTFDSAVASIKNRQRDVEKSKGPCADILREVKSVKPIRKLVGRHTPWH